MPRHSVIVCEALDADALAWLAERCDVTKLDDAAALTPDLLARADALVVRTYTRVDAALLAKAPRLRCVARAGVGLDNIDVAACRARNVEVVHTPGANADAVAEYVFALLLDALRPRTLLTRDLDQAAWSKARSAHVAPRELRACTIGIIGLGRVGSRVARIARGFAMPAVYNDLLDIPDDRRHGARPAALDHLLRTADIVTLHTDDRASNRNLIDAAKLALLRDAAVIINTSRGMVLPAAPLADFLRSRPRATAILDVHDPEPFGPDYPLLGLPNALLSPHLAAATANAHANMSWVVRDLWRVLSGEKPENPAPRTA